MSTENVVPFKIVASNPAAPAPLPDLPPDISEEQTEIIQAIAELAKFLLDNKMSVKNVICCVATTDPENPDPYYSKNHVFATPIEARDFTLGLKILEATFFKKLNTGSL